MRHRQPGSWLDRYKIRRERQPDQAVFSDDRAYGFTLNTRAKTFVVMLVLVLCLGVLYIFQRAQLANQRHTDAVKAQQHTDALVHRLDLLAKAVADETAQNKQDLRQFACYIMSQVPPDPHKPVIAFLRKHYTCPPFDPHDVGNIPPPLPSSKPGALAPSASSSVPRHQTLPRVSVSPGRSVTLSAPQPRPTPGPTTTRTITAPAPPPAPTPTPVLSRICRVIPIVGIVCSIV
jgi:hypothetical protein